MNKMFLPTVENNLNAAGPYVRMRAQVEASGLEAPGIFHLFAFKPEATEHLSRFTQAVMRGPSPLSPGLRELIAAFTSLQNHCPF
ncbi:MAG: peroxidase [Acidobacteria bacterium]|nr:peroxidase [Acidobacteriota bacterium]